MVAWALVGVGLVALPAPTAQAIPSLAATTIVSGLTISWDLTWVGSRMLYTLRAGEVWSQTGSSSGRVLDLKSQTYASGEGGLFGITGDPAAATNRVFYTCGAYRNTAGAGVDVRVRRWVLDTSGTSATGGSTVVAGLPLNTTGRHSGCRLRFGADGKLYVGTGDAAAGTNPQNLASLGGKVLRVNVDGTVPSDNPYVRLHEPGPTDAERAGGLQRERPNDRPE